MKVLRKFVLVRPNLFSLALVWVLASNLPAQNSPLANAVGPSPSNSGTKPERKAKRAILPPPKVYRYSERVIQVYDEDEDGQLDEVEWSRMAGDPSQIDADGDAIISVEEFARHVTEYAARRRIRLVSPQATTATEEPLLQPISARPRSKRGAQGSEEGSDGGADGGANSASPSRGQSANGTDAADPRSDESPRTAARRRDQRFYVPASQLPANLPSWFHARDRDGDGQISQAEYGVSMSPAALAEFNRYDRNRDGVITPGEAAPKTKGNSSRQQRNGNGR